MHSYRAGQSALLSFLISVCYALSCLIVSVSAANNGWDGRGCARRAPSWYLRLFLLTTIHVQCESKNPPLRFSGIFPKWLDIFRPSFAHLLYVPIYAWLQIFIQVATNLTKLCRFKRDHPVHVICANCPPSAETRAAILWHFPQTVGNF